MRAGHSASHDVDKCLYHNSERHFRLTSPPILENDWEFGDSEAQWLHLIDDANQEAIALQAHLVPGNHLDNFAPIIPEAPRAILNVKAKHNPGKMFYL